VSERILGVEGGGTKTSSWSNTETAPFGSSTKANFRRQIFD